MYLIDLLVGYIASVGIYSGLFESRLKKLSTIMGENYKKINREKLLQQKKLPIEFKFYGFIPVLNVIKALEMIIYNKDMAQEMYEYLDKKSLLKSSLKNDRPNFEFESDNIILISKEESKAFNIQTDKIISDEKPDIEKLRLINNKIKLLNNKINKRILTYDETRSEIIKKLTLERK